MVGKASVSCGSHRQEWHVTPVSKDRAPELSAICTSRRFIRRVTHLHLFFTRVAQTGWRGAQMRNLYKKSAFSDLEVGTFWS
ncbi:hypothetical protein A2U01_0083473 [Trifolium medium]|uniref:Uncharacterized protein n=1 Tax=Trifolium medium TaxID=97028 RepID=A0A392TQ15_9FABA|nr:hypothetical protein [Trifolium medium]